ncbi:DUF1330 domain-containing protein [Desulfobacter curvatus]|uniref:DUF1330 domain-containing protein n=1 Tax=Desulfobacter curvatus TaxID=2290 RepID=UPI00037BE91B|nr:DUF1330 domain-containing protein [Desulfobacter curvatus]
MKDKRKSQINLFGIGMRKNMSVYMIIQSSVKNEEKYNQYIAQVSPIVEKYGGCYHVRGENIRSLGSWNPERVIVIEFQSEDQIQNWLKSPEYAAIAPLREGGADAQAIIVEGYQKD